VEQANLAAVLREHRTRIRALEGVHVLGNGIDFNKLNNTDDTGAAALYLVCETEGDSTWVGGTQPLVSYQFRATGAGGMEFILDGTGSIVFEPTSTATAAYSPGDLPSATNTASFYVKDVGTGDMAFAQNDDTGIISIVDRGNGIEVTSYGGPVYIRGDGGIILHDLPTSDPGVTDQLWVDSSHYVRQSP
jgi:hypothetical protein